MLGFQLNHVSKGAHDVKLGFIRRILDGHLSGYKWIGVRLRTQK